MGISFLYGNAMCNFCMLCHLSIISPLPFQYVNKQDSFQLIQGNSHELPAVNTFQMLDFSSLPSFSVMQHLPGTA